MRVFAKFASAAALCVFIFVSAHSAQDWNDPQAWDTRSETDGSSVIQLSEYKDGSVAGIKAEFELNKPGHSYVVMRITPSEKFNPKIPVVFNIKANSSATMELKMVDDSGTTYWKTVPLKKKFATEFEIAPLSVLVDPVRLRDALSDREHRECGNVSYHSRMIEARTDTCPRCTFRTAVRWCGPEGSVGK